ncbi:MAG: glycosyltransferase family protein [Acidobacteria bacterium]|nr:glycosyltransferase family protein [Acidobacteriota bacterium]
MNGNATVGVIQARMGSTRLPGKVLAPTDCGPLLSLMLARVRRSRTVRRWIVATTTQAADDAIVALCGEQDTECFRGSTDDVLDRYYQATKDVGAEVVVRLTADCPLVDPNLIDKCVQTLSDRRLDFVSTTVPPPGTYPEGMDIEAMSFEALERSWHRAQLPSEREHVTFRIWKNPTEYNVVRLDSPTDLSWLRLTVDYPEDLEVIRRVVSAFRDTIYTLTLAQLVEWLAANPGVWHMNAHHEFGVGWKPALAKDGQVGRKP